MMTEVTDEKIERINLFSYIGGKYYLLQHILPHIPYTKCYCEPFFGSGKVFFARKPSFVEYINDIDKWVINVFRVVQDNDKFRELYKKIKRCFTQEDLIKEFGKIVSQDYDLVQASDVEKAFMFIYALNFTFSGIIPQGGFGVSKNKRKILHKTNFLKNMIKARQRLQNATILNTDALQLIQRLDDEKTTFYLDPPYFLDTRKENLYKKEMDNDAHVKLLEIIKNSKSAIVLSGYKNDLYLDYLKDWECIEIHTYCFSSNTRSAKRSQRIECIWKNKRACELTSKNNNNNQNKTLFDIIANNN